MVKNIVRYRVRPEHADDIHAAIADFVDAVAEHEPDTVYGVLACADGITFVHAMAFPDADAERRHRDAEYTQGFVHRLVPLCDLAPEFTPVHVVGSTKRGGGFLGLGGKT